MLVGLSWGVLFYLTALSIVVFLSQDELKNKHKYISLVILCYLLHFVSTYAYTLIPTDSNVNFFQLANIDKLGIGTDFIQNLTWIVRYLFTGDSYIGTLYFFSAFAFMGSVIWYKLYLKLCSLLKINDDDLYLPALVIMCWPSFLFFTSGIGKDSLCFFLLAVIFILYIEIFIYKKYLALLSILMVFSVILLVLIRPYLCMLLFAALYASIFLRIKKISLKRLALSLGLIVLIITIVYLTLFWTNRHYGGFNSGFTLSNILRKALYQQVRLNTGSSIPILTSYELFNPSKNVFIVTTTQPYMVLLTLPYNMIMNLTMPLFVFARGFTGYIASIENSFLVCMIVYFFYNISIYFHIAKKKQVFRYLMCFFIIGLAFLSLINTNLGLAMRQKSMYLPAFLIIIMLIWSYKKQKKIS